MSLILALSLSTFIVAPCLMGVLFLVTRAALGYAARKYGIDGEQFLEGE